MTAHPVHQEPLGLNHRAFRCHAQHAGIETAETKRRQRAWHTVVVIADEADVWRSFPQLLRSHYCIPDHHVASGPLADQQMPAMLGIQFLSRFGADQSKTVRLIVTARAADIQAVIDALSAGRTYGYARQTRDLGDGLTYWGPRPRGIRAADEKPRTAAPQMVQVYDTTLEGWSAVPQWGNQETDGHSRGISELAVCLAQAMGMPEAELLHVRRGALLHDIGKVAIPDRILIKPGPLTEDEWGIMKRHACYGYELLAPIAFLKEALDIPYCHHEKWDGSGYPRGLKGEQIPLAARIFAVIDVWDALASDRPYRKAWRERDARAYIHSLSGAHFDPQVVETFLRVVV